MTISKARRQLISGAPAVGAMFALSGCSRDDKSDRRKSSLGESRSVTWAVGTTGTDFVLDIGVGAADAATMLGWRFNRVLNAQTTPDAHINAIRQAVTARADVVITVAWYQAVVDEIARAMKDGTRFVVVNSLTDPAELAKLDVSFVGQDPYATGRALGVRLRDGLLARGVTAGTVLAGNPFPGSLNLEQRIGGIRDGLSGSGGSFQLVSFADGSAQDAASSVALYKAKIEQASNVVAHAIAGGELSAVPLIKALSENNVPPGHVMLAGWASSLKMLGLIKSGWIAFALDDGLYYQGMLAVQLAWAALERGMPASNLSPGTLVVDPSNVEAMIASYEKRRKVASAYGLA